MEPNGQTAIEFRELEWDTGYFGMTCAKAVLHKPLAQEEWIALKDRFASYDFVTIVNRNCEPLNAWFIGTGTTAFLVDVNVQFRKVVTAGHDSPQVILASQATELDEEVISLAYFPYSRFIEDPELAKRGGADVHRQWLLSSFGKPGKHLALAKGPDGAVNGFALYSYENDCCTSELIAVSPRLRRSGIGTTLFRAVESAAYRYGCSEMRVGTQLRNHDAVNFYHKLGCSQVECSEIYHLGIGNVYQQEAKRTRPRTDMCYI